MESFIYNFGLNRVTNCTSPEILGGKGAGLAEMSRLGLAVPPGFTISSRLSRLYHQNHTAFSQDIKQSIKHAIVELESYTSRTLGDPIRPLILSVRSGSVVSMPGMMDTVLNLGFTTKVFQSIYNKNATFAVDSYLRFLEMYSSIVLQVPANTFSSIPNKLKTLSGFEQHSNLIEEVKLLIEQHSKQRVPEDPYEQLMVAIEFVLKSWMSKRAVAYRKIHHISDELGTAVNVQMMVFGNLNNQSGTGVVFTRCPSTGENSLVGEFLLNAQGEDIVSGSHTPISISDCSGSMQQVMPTQFEELKVICKKLEGYYKDAQDIEFTIQDQQLYLLQTRAAKRTALAAIKIAHQMHQQGIVSKAEALMQIPTYALSQLLHNVLDAQSLSSLTCIAQGLAASPGGASGVIAFSLEAAEDLAKTHPVILVRRETSPEDVSAFYISEGILTLKGGVTSHAAVVARSLGRPCVCGVSSLQLDEVNKILLYKSNLPIQEGQYITIDGSTGEVFLGKAKFSRPQLPKELDSVLEWADELSIIKTKANAETMHDLQNALNFGAVGVGLCRTEHMFFEKKRMLLIQTMIISDKAQTKEKALNELLPLHSDDFYNLFVAMNALPISVRLLDPPLHEFLPKTAQEKYYAQEALAISQDELERRMRELKEVNPMLGNRGCRLGITYPEIYLMQIEALCMAWQRLESEANIRPLATQRANEARNSGAHIKLEDSSIGASRASLSGGELCKGSIEIMIPFISDVNELRCIKNKIESVFVKYGAKRGVEGAEKGGLQYKIGAMIELPRAALTAHKIAQEVDFFSFGTNDLTQTTYGFSRDDSPIFLYKYLEEGICKYDPFVVLDQEGVGELMSIAIQRARDVNPTLTFCVCGEQINNATTIDFLQKLTVDYISCSPYNVPMARIATAQTAIKHKRHIGDNAKF
ncbi:Pyruvate, phosphate dikinase [Rickettsiales endosymbiont of Paramecium tredecaurelia]|uniref:pyruvate, phosphate dikinase n=1 Tax=Candidatus Sarmatiella mevalonica TaxID=2770581 RepID=UPI001920E05D|nr:pyruvate, phosphate dikinase [Candidatus Sarmatiella mevalonica]MBL3285050.1 Pyruvate, phosphate dikinase [Candidatus Sarmatiella mevalonica]